MLEGLQTGQTLRGDYFTKNITQFMDINLNYHRAESELSKTIHTGNIQLRALFLNIINSLIISFKLRHNAVYVSCSLKGIQNNEYKQ
jgi:hypothetical protein